MITETRYLQITQEKIVLNNVFKFYPSPDEPRNKIVYGDNGGIGFTRYRMFFKIPNFIEFRYRYTCPEQNFRQYLFCEISFKTGEVYRVAFDSKSCHLFKNDEIIYTGDSSKTADNSELIEDLAEKFRNNYPMHCGSDFGEIFARSFLSNEWEFEDSVKKSYTRHFFKKYGPKVAFLWDFDFKKAPFFQLHSEINSLSQPVSVSPFALHRRRFYEVPYLSDEVKKNGELPASLENINAVKELFPPQHETSDIRTWEDFILWIKDTHSGPSVKRAFEERP